MISGSVYGIKHKHIDEWGGYNLPERVSMVPPTMVKEADTVAVGPVEFKSHAGKPGPWRASSKES